MSDSTQLKQLRRLRDKAALCLEEDRFKEAEEALTQAVALARQSDNDDNLAATLYEFGRCFWAQRMFKEAEPPLKQALEFQRDRSDARADTLLLLGSCALCEQSIEDAENWLREGVDIQAALYQDTDPRLAFGTYRWKLFCDIGIIRMCLSNCVFVEGLHELGVCLTYKGEYEKSKDVLLRAVVLQSDMPQRKLPTSHELAVCLTLLGQYHDAELHFRQSLKARSVRPGITRIALAGCLIEQFKLNQAEKELDQAMTVVSDTDCCARAYAFARMALCYQLARHSSEKVTELIKSSLEESRRTTNRVDKAKVLTIVGEVLTLQRQWTRAEKTLRIVLDIQKKFLPESHPDCIRTLARLGECWLYQGNFHTAKGFLEKALNSCKSTLHNHPERGKVLLAMGQQHVHGNSRNWAEAATCLTEAVRILGQSLGGHPITATASCELSECMTALGVATDATEVLIRALPVRTESLVSSSLSRRPGCEESQLELEVEALKHENGSLRQRLKQEQGSYQEEIRKLHSRCEMLEEQVSQLQAQQRDINLQDQQLFKMKQEVEYQSIRILFQQKAIRTHSERNDELLGKIEFLERNCRITEKRRLSIEQACREYQQKLMRYDNILTIPAEDVEVKEDLVLGEGSYGVVKHGRWRGCDVAVKRFHKLLLSEYIVSLVRQEMAMYSLVHHPNIIPLCGVILKNNCPVSLVLEMQEASLKEVMNAAHISGYYLTMREQIDLAVGLLAGLTYLHELRPDSILHGDVRPTNILVTALMVAKLGDLGAARLTKTSLSVGALSPDYVAPERVPGEVQTPSHNTKAADIYSAGVTIAELFTGKQTGREGRESQRTLIQDQDLFDICGEMESFDPSLRPHAKVALERVQRLYSHSAYEQSPAKRMVRGLLHGSRVVLVNTSCYLLSEI